MPMTDELLRTLTLLRGLREAREARLARENPEADILRSLPDLATILRRGGESGLVPEGGVGPLTPRQQALANVITRTRNIPEERYRMLAGGIPGAEDVEAKQHLGRMTSSLIHEFFQKYQKQAEIVSLTRPGTPHRATEEANMAALVGQYSNYLSNLSKAGQGPSGGAEAIGGIVGGPSFAPRSEDFFKAQEFAKTGPLEGEIGTFPGLEGFLEYSRGKKPQPRATPELPPFVETLTPGPPAPAPVEQTEPPPAARGRRSAPGQRSFASSTAGISPADVYEIEQAAASLVKKGDHVITSNGKWIVSINESGEIVFERKPEVIPPRFRR